MSLRRYTDATAFSGAQVVQLGANRERLMVTQPEGLWWETVRKQLDEFVALPRGWDGYSGRPVSFSIANFAVKVLEAVCGPDSPQPQIVPGGGGDLQLEWHLPGGDLELHVRAANDVLAWYRDSTTGPDGVEVPMTTNFIVAAKWLEGVEGAGAAVAAA